MVYHNTSHELTMKIVPFVKDCPMIKKNYYIGREITNELVKGNRLAVNVGRFQSKQLEVSTYIWKETYAEQHTS